MALDPFSELPDVSPDLRENRNWTRQIKSSMLPDIFDALTLREREVLEVLSRGKSNKEIGEELCITSHTVRAHVRNILQKLKVESRTHAVALWLRWLGGLPIDARSGQDEV